MALPISFLCLSRHRFCAVRLPVISAASVFAAPKTARPAAVRSGIGADLIRGELQFILDNE